MQTLLPGDRVLVTLYGLNPYAPFETWLPAQLVKTEPGCWTVKLDKPLIDRTSEITLHSQHRIRAASIHDHKSDKQALQ